MDNPRVSVGCREYRVLSLSTFSSELFGNRWAERLWSLFNELILKFHFPQEIEIFCEIVYFMFFVQVLVLTVGRRIGGAWVEPGWVWSRSVPVEPQDPAGAVMLCLHNGVGVGGSWFVDMCWSHAATRVYCRPIDGNIRFI